MLYDIRLVLVSCLLTMDVLIQDELSSIVAEGVFGKNMKFVSYETDQNLCGKDQFQSTVVFGTLATSDGSIYSILIKFKLRDPLLREQFKTDIQFHNEILMYESIIPFLLACHRKERRETNVQLSMARYFYGRNKCGDHADNDLIVLENVCPLGFRLSEEQLFLDYDHLLNAIRALAKFHALSYAAKHIDPVGFREIVADIEETQFEPDGRWLHLDIDFLLWGTRGANRLLERDGDRYRDDERFRRLVELIADGGSSLHRALRPREPLSVLCHGDFNRNNVLFRYDANGRPVDAMPFDFARPRYGSPALDLSFFLYMNTTQHTRELRYGDLLDEYCSAVAAAVPPGFRAPDRAQVHAEMASSALYGLAHASFFLPRMIRSIEGEEGDSETEGSAKEIEYVADMVQHLVDMGYTDV